MPKLLPRFSGLAAVLTFVIGLWAVSQAGVTGAQAQDAAALYIPMMPTTAVLFMLLGGAHAARRLAPRRVALRRAEQLTAGLSIVAVAVVLSQDLPLFASFWKDVAQWLGVGASRPLARMAPSSGLAFLLTAVSMLSDASSGPRARRLGNTCAALAIAIGCFGLSRAVVAHPAALASRPMALMAAGGFVLLNLALLLDRRHAPDATDRRVLGIELATSSRFLAATLILILVAASAGSIYMRQRSDEALLSMRRDLDSFADAKAAQIIAWRAARVGEGRYLMRVSRFAEDAFTPALGAEGPNRQRRIRELVSPLLVEGRARSLTVTAPDGRTVLSLPEGHGDALPLHTGQRRWTDAELGDIRRDLNGRLLLDLVVPVGNLARPSLLILHLDPSVSLLPIIHSRPTGLKSVESSLWSRHGDHVTLLTEPSHGLSPEGRSKTHGVSRALAGALTGLEGADSLEGVDHHGTPVVGAARSIPGSPWTLTTTITQAELYEPAQEDASRTAFFVIVFLFGLVGFAAYVAREQGARTLEAALRAERERTATADRMAALMKGANDMILLFDDASRIVDVNDRVIETYGYTREELIGSSVARLRADGDESAVTAHRAALAAPGGGHFESVHRRKDGSTFPIEVSGRGVEVDGRTVVMAIYRDVSERRAHEEALRRSEERLRLLGDNLPDSYLYQVVQDDAGVRRFVYASSGVEKLHGVPVADLLQDPALLYRQAVPEDLERLVAAEATSLREMQDFAIEIRIRRADGGLRWLHIRSRPRPAGNGAVVWDGVAADVTTRKQAEEALRQVQSAVEQSPVSILIADIDGTIRFVNPAFTRVTGFTSEEAIGRNPRELLGDENDPAMHADVEECLRTGRVWEGVFRNRKKNGQQFWEHTRIAPVRNERGVFASYVAVKEDITARRAAEEALKASESKLSVALDIADLGCYETWMEDDRGAVDQRTRSLFGIRAEKESEMRAALLANVHSQDRDRVIAAVRRFRTGEADRFEAEYRYARPGGPEIRVSHIARAIGRASDGSVTHTIGVVKDVTADRTAAEALRASEARHRLLADNASDVIWTTDTEGRITYVSPSVERLRGYSPVDLLGRHVVDSVTPEDRERVLRMFQDAVAGYAPDGAPPEPTARFEIDQPCRNGAVVRTEVTASPMFDAERRFVGILGVTRDITARHAADQALKDSEFRLQMAIETAQLGIIELRDGGHSPNAIACDVLGADADESDRILPLWLSRIHAGDLERVTQIRESFLSGRRPTLRTEYRYQHPTKGQVWISHASRALEFDAEGRTIRAVVVVRDITDVRKAEQDVRASESRLAMALEVAELGIYWSDGMSFASDARALSILGVTGTDWPGVLDQWTRQLHPEHKDVAVATLRRIRDGHAGQVHLEYRYHHPHRGTVWISHSLRVVEKDGSGEPEKVIGVVEDVTAAREAAEALRRSEELFRAGLEAIQEGFVVLDRSHAVVVQNAAADRILGPKPAVPRTGDTAPARFTAIHEDGSPFPPEDYPSSRTFRDGLSVRDTVMGIVQTEGEPRWISVSSAPIGGGEAPEMVVLFFTDITARRKAERLLRLAEDRWKFAIEGAGDGVWDWDVPGGTCVFSPRWKEMLGYADDEIGTDLKEWSERVHPDDLPRVMENLQPHLEGHQDSYVAEHRLRCKDGSYKWILDRGLVVSRDANGRPLRVVGTHSDITERRQAEEDLRTLAATRAAQLDELRRWQQAMLGREDRIQELKREANALAKAAGREVPYPSQEPVA